MVLSNLTDLFVLYILGIIGWKVFQLLRLPNPPLLGSVLLIGTLRVLGVELAVSPALFSPITQMCLGLFIGSMINQDTLRQIKMILPLAILIMLWVLTFAFGAGAILTRFTSMDFLTATLACSTGGLPEMTVLAVETGANAPVVVFVQIFRILTVMFIVPLVARIFLPKTQIAKASDRVPTAVTKEEVNFEWKNLVFTSVMALTGGWLFHSLKIPAGAMLGSMSFVIVATLLGRGVSLPTHPILDFVQIGVGIMAADKISPEIITAILSGDLISIFLKSTAITFVSSVGLIYVIHKISKWDWLTCILAGAPAGLTAMAVLAFDYDRDPVPISILHVCRVMILKAAIPLLVVLLL